MSTTQQQSDAARGLANRTRFAKAAMRSKVKSGGVAGAAHVAGLLDDPPDWLESTYVWQLLLLVPMIGDVKAERMLRSCRIDPWRRVGRMSLRMRGELAVQLRRHADRPGSSRPQRPARPVPAAPVPVDVTPTPVAIPPPVSIDVTPAPVERAVDPLVCRACSAPMIRLSRSGVCGFCIAEALEGRRAA